MTERSEDSSRVSIETKAKVIACIMAIVALISPYSFSYYFDYFDEIYIIQMDSLIWTHWSNVIPTIIFFPLLLVNNPINTVLRLWFVFEMHRWYIGKSSKRRAIYVGLISEAWQFCIMALNLPLILLSPIFQLFNVPIPLLLIVGLIVLFTIQPHELPGLWEDKTEEDDKGESTEFLRSE